MLNTDNARRALLQELITVLDAMEIKELIYGKYIFNGRYCAVGALLRSHNAVTRMVLADMCLNGGTVSSELMAEMLATPLECVREVEEENDGYPNTDDWSDADCAAWGAANLPHIEAQRWQHMRDWAEQQLAA